MGRRLRVRAAEAAAQRRRFLRAAHIRRRAGRAMVTVAAIGLATAVVGTVVVWLLVRDVDRATAGSLDVTIQTLSSLQSTVDVADQVLESTITSLSAVETNLQALDAAFTSGSAVLTDAADLTGATEPALRNFTATLRRLQTLGTQIDGLLVTVSRLPLAPGYDPRNGLGVTFGQLADSLDPLPDKFAATSRSLSDFTTSLADVQRQVAALSTSVHDVNQGLGSTRTLLGEYRTNVQQAQLVAEASRADLRRDRTLVLSLVVVAGLNFAAVQLAPLWLGYQLLDEDEDLDADGPDQPEGAAGPGG